MIIYLFLVINIKSDNIIYILFEYILIVLLTSGINLWLTIVYISDDFSNKKYLYMKSSISKIKILLSKLLVIFVFTLLSLILSTLVLNLKLYFFEKDNSLEFFRMNLDNFLLVLINRTPLEVFYPVNYLLNLMYGSLTLIAIFTYYRYLLIHTTKVSAFLTSSFVILFLVNLPARLLSRAINFLDFNYINPRVNVMHLNNGEINFLSVVAIIIYSFISFMMIIKISKAKEVNPL